MKQEPVFRIPMKPHLKKFVLKRARSKEPLQVNERSLLGRNIMKVLQETRKHKFDSVLYQYTDRLQVTLTHDMMERSPNLKRLVYVNTEIEKEFKEAIFIWVEAQMEMNCPANEACKNFLEYYGIDDTEYTYDATYKAWQRYKEDEDLKNKRLRLRSA